MDPDTIIAISSPLGASLQSIIRLSGPSSFKVIEQIFSSTPSPKSKLRDLPSYTSISGQLRLENPAINIPVTLYLMKSPYSYTRDDVVEIHTIGSPPLLQLMIEDLSTRPGIRLAEPGEFTKRAFLNGRLDLAQGEAVLAIIKSRNERELGLALNQLAGNFSDKIKNIRQTLINLLAKIEASIDFSDQDIELIPKDQIDHSLHQLIREIKSLLQKTQHARVFSKGIICVICGQPNVGKSSLFNRLAVNQKTIVNPLAGTTRDVIEGSFNYNQISFRLFDTAGLKDLSRVNPDNSSLDQQAADHTVRTLQEADIFLMIVDGTRRPNQKDKNILKQLDPSRTIFVINKTDLKQKITPASLKRFLAPLEANSQRLLTGLTIIQTSALKGKGINSLKRTLALLIHDNPLDSSSAGFLINTRHRLNLSHALGSLHKTLATAKASSGYELLALDLRDALDHIGEIIGKTYTEDVLDHIFSQFCIGK